MAYDIDKLIRSLDNCYYHSFPLKKEAFTNIMSDGIKCFNLLNRFGSPCGAWNGRYYISLLKQGSKSFILQKFENRPLLIISPKIIAFKAQPNNTQVFTNTIMPIRYSPYDKEYQAFFHIATKNIVGISYRINKNDNDYEQKLMIMKMIIEWMNEIECNVPLINSYNNQLIDKEKVLSLIK